MGRILKAGSVKMDHAHPVFIKNGQENEAKKEKEHYDNQATEKFAEQIFQILSPTQEVQSSVSDFNKPQSTVSIPDTNYHKPTIGLSNESKQTKAIAAIEALKVKELELEALKQQLRDWEEELHQKEYALMEKERVASEEIINRRKAVESEAANTMKMAREAAATMTQAARSEAESIKATAQAEQAAIREKAYNDGHKEGYSVGEAKGISAGELAAAQEIKFDWNNLMQESEMLVNELQTSRMGILKSSEEEILKLAIAFAKTIIKTEPLIQPDIVLKNIEEAINKVAETDKIIMRVNMHDKSMCEDHKNKFLSRLSSVSELIIVEDPNLSPGGIKIETSVGTIDATIESQTKELEKALMEKYNKSLEEQ